MNIERKKPFFLCCSCSWVPFRCWVWCNIYNCRLSFRWSIFCHSNIFLKREILFPKSTTTCNYSENCFVGPFKKFVFGCFCSCKLSVERLLFSRRRIVILMKGDKVWPRGFVQWRGVYYSFWNTVVVWLLAFTFTFDSRIDQIELW